MSSAYREHQLRDILERAIQRGKFDAAVLADCQGLPLAEVESDLDPDVLSGLSTLLEHIARRAEDLLGWRYVEEVSLIDDKGMRMVTRQFQVDDIWYILIVVVPKRRVYRRSTNICLRELRLLLNEVHNMEVV